MFRNIRTLILFLSVIFFLSLFFSSCGQQVQSSRTQCYSGEYYDFDREECVRDDRANFETSSRTRTSSNRNGLRSVNDDINFRTLRISDFDGADCDESEECIEQCEFISSRVGFVNRCEDLPEDMVDILYATYQDLEMFNSNTSNNFNVSAFGTLLNIEQRVLLDLVEEDWSERNAAEFLIQIASYPSTVDALEKEDEDNEFFKEVLKTLNRGSSNIFESLLKSLQRYRQTFVSQAVESNNEKAVIKAFDLISNKNDFVCQRTERSTRTSSRYGSQGGGGCHYLNTDSRRSRSSDYCYVYGPNVWSYINNLDQGDISFTGYLATNELSEESCEVWCEGHLRCEYEE